MGAVDIQANIPNIYSQNPASVNNGRSGETVVSQESEEQVNVVRESVTARRNPASVPFGLQWLHMRV